MTTLEKVSELVRELRAKGTIDPSDKIMYEEATSENSIDRITIHMYLFNKDVISTKAYNEYQICLERQFEIQKAFKNEFGDNFENVLHLTLVLSQYEKE